MQDLSSTQDVCLVDPIGPGPSPFLPRSLLLLFRQPSEFFRSQFSLSHKPNLILVAWCMGIAASLDRLESSLMREKLGRGGHLVYKLMLLVLLIFLPLSCGVGGRDGHAESPEGKRFRESVADADAALRANDYSRAIASYEKALDSNVRFALEARAGGGAGLIIDLERGVSIVDRDGGEESFSTIQLLWMIRYDGLTEVLSLSSFASDGTLKEVSYEDIDRATWGRLREFLLKRLPDRFLTEVLSKDATIMETATQFTIRLDSYRVGRAKGGVFGVDRKNGVFVVEQYGRKGRRLPLEWGEAVVYHKSGRALTLRLRRPDRSRIEIVWQDVDFDAWQRFQKFMRDRQRTIRIEELD